MDLIVALRLYSHKGHNLIGDVFKQWGKPGLFFVLFSSFSDHNDKKAQNLTYSGISKDVVLGIQTWDRRMVGADKSTSPLEDLFILTIWIKFY